MCVCVCAREREKERKRDREREREAGGKNYKTRDREVRSGFGSECGTEQEIER